MKLRFVLLTLCFAALATAAVHADTPAAKPAPPVAAPAKTADSDEAKTYPAQASVAAKGTFGTVVVLDKPRLAAMDAKSLAEARKLIGKTGSFQGIVTQVYSPKNHSFLALDFAPHYRDALTANIAPADYAKFPDLTKLVGAHIWVSGKFVLHGDAIQVAVTSPDQILFMP